MNVPIAKSSFQSGADQSLTAVDVYSQSSEIGVTAQGANGYSKPMESNALETKRPSVSAYAGSNTLLSMRQGQLEMSPQAMFDTLLLANPTVYAAYREIHGATGMAVGAIKGAQNIVRITQDSINQVIRAVDASSVMGLFKMIKAITEGCIGMPDFIVEDIGTIVALLKQLIHQASLLNIKGLFEITSLCSKFKGTPFRQLSRGLGSNLLETPSVDLLREMAECGGGQHLLEERPDFLSAFCSSYARGYISTVGSWQSRQQDFSSDWQSMAAAFELISPGWSTTGFGFDTNILDRAATDVWNALTSFVQNEYLPVGPIVLAGVQASTLRRISVSHPHTAELHMSMVQHLKRVSPIDRVRSVTPLNLHFRNRSLYGA